MRTTCSFQIDIRPANEMVASEMIRILRSDLAADRERNQPASPLRNAFMEVFRAEECGNESRATEERDVVIVLPDSVKTWLQHMLRHAGRESTLFYVVCTSSDDARNDTAAGLVHYLVESGHAATFRLSGESNLITSICAAIAAVQASRKPLLSSLERAFPGGIEALLEISLRPTGKDHGLIAYSRQRPAALSLAFGACLVGELSLGCFTDLCSEASFDGSDQLIRILQNASDIRCRIEPDANQLTPLSRYLHGRKITVVEDRLETDRWAGLLPELLGNSAEGAKLPPRCRHYRLAGILWSHYETLEDLIGEPNELEACDIVLLDLASSDGPHPDGLVSPMLRSQLVKLAANLARIRKARDPDSRPIRPEDRTNHSAAVQAPRVRTLLPIVIGFTATQNGVTTRTLLQDIAIDDFFFKAVGGPVHQRLHYYTLRQAIIGALERRAAWIAYTEPDRFRDWILQFVPAERPALLRMMECYRHYSSHALIAICCDALCMHDSPLLPGNSADYTLSYLGRPGKSGPMALTLLAKAIDISSRLRKRASPSIITYDDYIATARSEKARAVVFVDDFVGTGGQVEENLAKVFERSNRVSVDRLFVWFMVGLDTPELRKFISGEAIQPIPAGQWLERIFEGTPISVRIEEIVPPYAPSANEERILRNHRLITAGRDWEVPCQFEPFGWKESCGLVSLFSNVPGNTLPIIWAAGHINPWQPLRERFFNPFAKRPATWERLPPCLQEKNTCALDERLPVSTPLGDRAPERQCAHLGCNIKLQRDQYGL